MSEMFQPYLWGEKGLSSYVRRQIEENSYGEDLRLLLIMYFVEGRFDTGSPVDVEMGNYSFKKREVSVRIPVLKASFHSQETMNRRKFIVDSTLLAVDMVRNRLEKRNLDIDFASLRRDVERAGEEYLAQST